MTTEKLKEKLALEEASRKKKVAILRGLDTKRLVDMLSDLEDKLEAKLRAEASYRDLNTGFLSSGNQDCAEVKRMLAQLTLKGPADKSIKMTAPEREAWLVLQRTEGRELSSAIAKQKDVAFGLENTRVDVEMAKKKLESIHKILSLKTAQIRFLTETQI